MVARPSGLTLRARVYKMQYAMMLEEGQDDRPKQQEF